MSSASIIDKQKFSSKWFYFIYVPALIILLLGFGTALFSEPQNNLVPKAFIPVFLLMAIVFFILTKATLSVEINSSTIKYKFFPFQFKERVIEFKDVNHISVEAINPLKDFYGYGIKFGKEGKACIANGNSAMKIIFKNGEMLYIGISKTAEIKLMIAKSFPQN